jgi:formylglycine-generating enzyme required for sulfatase activity
MPRPLARVFVSLSLFAIGSVGLVSCVSGAPSTGEPETEPLVAPLNANAPEQAAAPNTQVESPAPVVVQRNPDPVEPDEPAPRTLKEQREQLFRAMGRDLDLTADQMLDVEGIFARSPVLGQGNPIISKHPMTPAQCRQARADAGLTSEAHAPCERANMVPVYDADAGETAKDAKVCIDHFEFPDIACEYPVVHVQAREAALLCEAEGKRLCDAHEWEGACAGSLHPVDEEYAFGSPRPMATKLHNDSREKTWAYGAERNLGLCATGSFKTAGCPGGGYNECGSNTYPAGAFPSCVSPFGVFDQHGNAAEHMSLPLDPEQLGSRGGHGSTEMKGSWFVFQRFDAHEDDCRWRAPDWHPSKVMSETSHENYHLSFRCCADVNAS